MPVPFPVYRPRNSQQTPYYRCVEDHLKTLEQVYEDRFESLLLELSRCIWETLKIYYQSCLPGKNSVPGAVIALQTFGDFLGFNPHGHVLITDGCFPEKGLFVVAPTVKLKYLEKIFRSKIFTLLLAKGKITPDLIKLLKSWRHSLRAGGRVSGFLRPPHPSPGKSLYGKPGSVHYPGLFLARTDDLSPG